MIKYKYPSPIFSYVLMFCKPVGFLPGPAHNEFAYNKHPGITSKSSLLQNN